MGSEKRSTRATEANDSGGARARTWRWGVWHEDDRAWLASLQERNARLLPLLQSDRCTAPAATATPRVIHQIWLGPHPIPESCRAWMQTWTAHHPTWEYIAFDAACNYGEKADILRYEILERHGGVYADVDVACLRSFDRLLETFSFAAGIANTGCVEISNSVIVAAPRHPILQRLIEVIEQKFKQPRLDDNALMRIAQMSGDLTLIKSLSKKENGPDAPMLTIARTGPGLLTKTFMAAVGWTGRNGAVEGFLVSDRHRDGVIALPIEFLSPLPNDVNATATAAPTSDSAVAVFPTVPMAVHYWSRTWIRS